MNAINEYNKNSIIFTSAFKDIGRNNWSNYGRTNELYIETFLNLANNIDYILIVYVEEPMYNTLLSCNLKSNIVLISYSNVNTFYNAYIENERKMISSIEYKQKIPTDRTTNPEHWSAEYNLVNHSKINFVSHTKKLYPNYEYYGWIDFGCIRNRLSDVPKNIDFSKLENKICYLALTHLPIHPIDANTMLKSHTVYLAGSQFVTHRDLVETHEELYKNLLEKWKKDNICDDDQNAILQVYFENKDAFKLYYDNEWFSLFSKHLNFNTIN
jgi:hypothetical protein